MLVAIKYLKPGMTLIEDVTTREGNMLIPKNTVLTERYIVKLMEFGIGKVYIDGEGIYDGYSQDFDESYNNALYKLKSAFETVKYKKQIDITEYRTIINSLYISFKMGRNLLAYMKITGDKDEYLFQHSINVSLLAMLMGKWLGYDDNDIKTLGLAALLHDIGVMKTPADILYKSEKLSSDEYIIVKNHTRLGFQILKYSNVSEDIILNAALTHHERLDGKGYPFGLSGANLSEKIRIVSICDVYDAVTSERPYKRKQNPLKGFKIISDNSYKGLDAYLSKVFINNGVTAYNGCSVTFSDGTEGKIIRVLPENPSRPWVVRNGQFVNLENRQDIEIVDVLI